MKLALGFDLHRLVSGKKLKICGVEIPFEKGLLGHSDADVGLHALIDAILAAAGLPDIGTLFPDKDPRYKNIDSLILLKKTLNLIQEKNLKVSQADFTFICDYPRLSPYYEKMKSLLSKVLNLDSAQISIKARSTEGLGWENKKEAIACFCLVVLEKN